MSSSILESYSQISAVLRCNNCDLNIDRVSWKQCIICHRFNLCEDCDKYQYDTLESLARINHIKFHQNIGNNDLITSQCIKLVSMDNVSEDIETKEETFSSIMQEGKIQNDIDMSVVDKFKKMNNESLTEAEQGRKQELCSRTIDYYMCSFDRILRILSLDGGGVRGYMPIKVLEELIIKKHLGHIENFDSKNDEHRKQFHKAQLHFTNQFDYFAGTSTGGLIAFCLAIGYDILKLKDIYTNASYYFNRNFWRTRFGAKYNPSRIHDKIDEIIDTININGQNLSAQNATLFDIHNLLNPDAHVSNDELRTTAVPGGGFLPYVDDYHGFSKIIGAKHQFHRVERERALRITAYNATHNEFTVFNSSYLNHWSYRIADVLKATMAAPTYFPPQKMSHGIIQNGQFIPKMSPKIFVDGGIFANDPELMALWGLKWKQSIHYHILSIGTGAYNTQIEKSNLGGYFRCLSKNRLLVNTLMEATCGLTEHISSNLAKLNNIKRIKFNHKLIEPMSLDDVNFIKKFDEEWEDLKEKEDFTTLVQFYDKYILEQQH